MFQSWYGVLCAGALFGLTICIVSLTYSTFSPFGYVNDRLGFISIAFAGIVYSTTAGFVLALISSSVVILLLAILNWSLGAFIPPRIAVSLFGGGTGFLLTFPIAGLAEKIATTPNWITNWGSLVSLCVPPLAMLFGHVGALTALHRSAPGLVDHAAKHCNRKYQFQIRQIFVLTTWFAILAWLTSILGRLFFVWICVGAVLQAFLLLFDFWWLKSISRARQPRAATSVENRDAS